MIRREFAEAIERWKIAEKTFKRDVEDEILPFIGNKNVVFLYGPRRSGKSVVAKRLLNRMPKNSEKRYVNLEDPVFSDSLDTRLMDELSDGLGGGDTIVFDEVQLISGWEKWVRWAVDNRKCNILVTGSSSKLLSGEFASSLGGRGFGFRVLPLSFREFHRVTGKGIDHYMKTGGYPEVVLNPEKKEKLLESYFELALIKDIVSRHNIRDVSALRNLAFYLLTNSGKETSLRKIRVALGLSYDSIRQFIDFLEASFLVFQVPFFSYSMKESLTKPRKIYAYDLGMQQYVSKSFSSDRGRLLEAAVAIELKHRNEDIFYWNGKKEVDFVARNKTEIGVFNVCCSESLPEREFNGLKEFGEKYKAKNYSIIYSGKNGIKRSEGIDVKLNNLEKWLLKN